MMEKLLYPNHPIRCIITGPSEFGKKCFSNRVSFKYY